jgi:hypothetical protein
MKFNVESPQKALKYLFKQNPLRSEMNVFKSQMVQLLDKISIIEQLPHEESEEHLKNDLRDFLKDTYYKDFYAMNTKDKKDLVIHTDKTIDSEVGVIIEVKRPSNIQEMVQIDNLHKKAFYELILYYFDERVERKNIELKHLIITNIEEWYMIDSNDFDKYIYQNTQIKKLYEVKIHDKKSNVFFYEEIAKIIAQSEIEIPCVYFNLKSYEQYVRKENGEEDRELIALFKILSPKFLLKNTFGVDSNSLNEQFYHELLHILGLEEVKEGAKILITRKKENRNAGALIELTIEALKTENVSNRLHNIQLEGVTQDEKLFEIALELCITWINRILFLKLLESQLVSYHKGDKSYYFLNTHTIPQFNELFKLFHKVLAIKTNERAENIQLKYKNIPYLNSSLFEISELEDKTIKIQSLDNQTFLSFFANSVLYHSNNKVTKLPTLDYLFQFLDAYNFASESEESIQEDNKSIINASVLGKVFEKINGYKDGAVFTPSFITMYMCKEAIHKAVIQKFNEIKNWNIQTIEQLYNKIDDKKEANQIINSLKICDPAVGSGHFLVSALNEIIALKSKLKVLMDKRGWLLKDYVVEVLDDELVVYDADNQKPVKYFVSEYYNPQIKGLSDRQIIFETLFHEKQTIIENCLFGVDINPNSVKICRLRLWIELLKNAYYIPETRYQELQTLPNIDINIKCGNSLLSRFDVNADLTKVLKSIKYDIKAYRDFVNEYKNCKDKEVKNGIEKIIANIKSNFRIEIAKFSDPRILKLQRLSAELFLRTNDDLFNKGADKKNGNGDGNGIERDKIKKIEDEVNRLSKELEDEKNNMLYQNAFEWRFEFPEVLNDNGDFEGFDVIIGNPPYIDIKGLLPKLVTTLFELYQTTENRINLFSLFIERSHKLLKNNGILYFIIPNSLMMNSSYSKIRTFIHQQVFEIVKLPDNVFSASNVIVETIILAYSKGKTFEDVDVIKYKHNDKVKLIDPLLKVKQTKSIWDLVDLKFNIYLTDKIQAVLSKIHKNTLNLYELADFSLGITPYDKYKGHTEKQIKERVFHSEKPLSKEYKPIITGENIQPYFIDNQPKEYIKYGDWLGAAREERFFTEPRVIVRQIVSGNPLRIYAGFTKLPLYFTQIGFAIIPKNTKEIHPKYLTALLNSSLINFTHKYLYLDIEKEVFQKILIENCKRFPIKKIPLKDQKVFISLVDKILEAKEKGKDSSELEKKIDTLVYELYEISTEEQKLIES